MADTKSFTYADVAQHNTKKDVYMVIHDKVYNATRFVDEHPGGEEVMLDVAGQDATEAFEDVGHSDEARETLDGLYVGDLIRQPGDPKPKVPAPGASTAGASSDNAAGFGIGLYAVLLIGGAAAYAAYTYMQAQQQKQ